MKKTLAWTILAVFFVSLAFMLGTHLHTPSRGIASIGESIQTGYEGFVANEIPSK